MTVNFPTIIGYGTLNIKEKMDFYKKINFVDMIINDSKLLSFSFDIIKSRYEIITDNKIDNSFYKDLFEDNVVVEDLKNYLFCDDETFYNKYGVRTY